MDQINKDLARTLLDAGASQLEARSFGEGMPFVVTPNDYEVSNLEKMLISPVRKRGAVITTDSAGFITYTKKHGNADSCIIYANIDSERSVFGMAAVINDHASDKAQWRDHRCLFSPKLSVEWDRWVKQNRAQMSQADFAAWLEDNLGDIASVTGMPTGAEILGMALAFEANADKRLRSKINLQSGGVRFEFVEDEDKDTRASMEVFSRFWIGIPVFDGSTSAYPLEARLKYRDKGGSLTFWYELIRPDRVFKTAVTEELGKIIEGTGFTVIAGRPE